MTKSSSASSYQVQLAAHNHNTIKLGLIFIQIYSSIVEYQEKSMYHFAGYGSNAVLNWYPGGVYGTTLFQGLYYSIDYVQTTGVPIFYRVQYESAVGQSLRFIFYNPFNFNNFKYNFLFINKTLLASYQYVVINYYYSSQTIAAPLNSYQLTTASLFYFRYSYITNPTYFWKLDTTGSSITFNIHQSLVLQTYSVHTLVSRQISCFPNYYVIEQNICAPVCPSASYINNNYCINCPQANCWVCTASVCITCSKGTQQLNSNCKCLPGFFQLQKFCQPCPSRCLVCSNYYNCLICEQRTTYSKGSCQPKTAKQYTVSYDGRIKFCSDKISRWLQNNLKFKCQNCKVMKQQIENQLDCLYYKAAANFPQQKFRVQVPVFQDNQNFASALNITVNTRFPIYIASPDFLCQQLPDSPQNLTCTISATGIKFRLKTQSSRLYINSVIKKFEFKYEQSRILIVVQLDIFKSFDAELELRIQDGGLLLDPPSLLQNNILKTSLRIVFYSSAQRQLSKFVARFSSDFFKILNIVMSVLNVLGLLKGVQIIFSITTFLIIMSPYQKSFPLSFKAVYVFLLKLQNILMPDQIYKLLSQTLGQFSFRWLCVYFAPIMSAIFLTILIRIILSFFKCGRVGKQKQLIIHLLTVSNGYLRVSSGFSYGTLKIATDSKGASISLISIGVLWVWLIFLILIKQFNSAKQKTFLSSKLVQFIFAISSFLCGTLSLIVEQLSLFAALILSLQVLRLIIIFKVEKNLISAEFINSCGQALMCLWLVLAGAKQTIGFVMSIALLCTLSTLMFTNLGRAIRQSIVSLRKISKYLFQRSPTQIKNKRRFGVIKFKL